METKVLSLFIVVAFAFLGRLLFESMNGFRIPRFYFIKPIKVSPLFRKIKIPSVIGMIIMGFISRNFFGHLVAAYPSEWAA